ncbi:transposase [Kitasatospora cineracea]|uniref:transposase n=1 Tax=Kitasatospora cineracea TaxID=88074 RepID=UPI000F47C607
MIEPLLPVGQYGPYPQPVHEQFEDVVCRFRAGSQWRKTPRGEFGAWQRVHERFAYSAIVSTLAERRALCSFHVE